MKRGGNRTKAAVKYKKEREHGCLSIGIYVNEREKFLSPFELFPLNCYYNTKGYFNRKQFHLCPTFCTCDLYDRSLTEIKFYSYNWHFTVYISITHVSFLVIYMLLLCSWQILYVLTPK